MKEAIHDNDPFNNLIHFNSNGIPLVLSLSQLEKWFAQGYRAFDFSLLNVNDQNLSGKNLAGFNITINLNRLFLPIDGSFKIRDRIIRPTSFRGHAFIDLRDTNLQGNKIIGNLSNMYPKVNSSNREVIFLYSESTFDNNFKQDNPQYFLAENAPQELKNKYYQPQIVIYPTIATRAIQTTAYKQTLTFSEYMQYYEFLQGKYLARFSMNASDLRMISLVEKYGLEETKRKVEEALENEISLPIIFKHNTDYETSSYFTAEELLALIDNTIERQKTNSFVIKPIK